MKILVSFSGGKDSQACLIQACKEFGTDKVTAVFCDTGWEHELTYRHIDDVTKQLGVKLEVLRNKNVDGFIGLCKRMRWFPDSQHRMCTVQLKIQPMIDYILEQDENLVIIQGIRAAESASRSKLPCSADYFAEYFADNKKRLYRKTDVQQWCGLHYATVERPMIGMSAQDIINFILDNGQQPNPLYRRGASRVGCYPCIFSRLSELKAMRKDEKYVQRLIRLENEINNLKVGKMTPSSFFPKGKIPEKFCKRFGNGIPAFEDIIEYVSRYDAQLDMFESDENLSCMSVYHGLCE